jgi:ethanolaminephosphotransferase
LLAEADPQITFLGLCFVFANVGTLMWFDRSYEGKDLPSWVYLSWAFGLFAYQSEQRGTSSH